MFDTSAPTDGVTGALGRSDFDRIGREELRRATRYGRPTALMLVEIDAFLRLFERFGQAAGDAVLRALAAQIRTQLREHDTLARVGEAAFAVLLPETEERGALFVAERLCRAAGDLQVEFGERAIGFTVSIGVAGCIAREDDLDGALQDADAALAEARRSGGVARAPASRMADDEAAAGRAD